MQFVAATLQKPNSTIMRHVDNVVEVLRTF